jgi:hypothetical protein
MKRDMDLLRRMAFEVEALAFDEALVALPNVTADVFFAHAEWLIESGLAEGSARRMTDGSPGPVTLTRLTWSGCEFVDAVRNDTLWSKAKANVLAPGASFTIDLLKEWLKIEISQGFPTFR